MIKTISSLKISNTGTVNANGGVREIVVSGDVGARFTLIIKNSSGKNILEDYLNDIIIPKSGLYKLSQKFPVYESNNFTRVDNVETYTIEVLPTVFTKLNKDIVSHELKQYPNPTITLTSTSSHSISGSNSTLVGKAMTLAETIPNNFTTSSSSTYTKKFGEIVYNITISPADGLLYVSKNPNLLVDLKKSTDIKRNTGEKKTSENMVLTLPPSDVAQYATPIEEGMIYSGSYTYTKLFDSNISDDNEDKFSNKIRLNDTKNLVIGMVITGSNIKGYTTITAIDTDTDITTSLKQKLIQLDQLTFTKKITGLIDSVGSASSVTTDSKDFIPSNIELTFSNDTTSISGRLHITGSGSDTITLNGTYQVGMFGKKDVTYTQLTDNFLTVTPNAYTQYITTTKDTSIVFDLLSLDTDDNKDTKTPVWEARDWPSHGVVTTTAWASGVGTTTYKPYTGFTGTDKFYFYTNDGANSSARTPVYITIT